MGMFDNLFDSKSRPKELSQAEAFAGILFCASACDEHIAEDEGAGLFAITDRMQLFKGMTDDQWEAMTHRLIKLIEHEGLDKSLDACVAVLPEDLRDCAFANACDLILCDGVVEEDEQLFLELLQQKLQLDGDTAVGIVEVMLIKNKN